MTDAVTQELPIMLWDAWSLHPDWLTERQLKAAGLVPGGAPVAQVWYSNKKLRRQGKAGHYLMLYEEHRPRLASLALNGWQASNRPKQPQRLTGPVYSASGTGVTKSIGRTTYV
jgi:hypothetical protein